jgi:type VI secretion system protein ImpG
VGIAVAGSADDAAARHLRETSVVPVGFATSEGMLPTPPAAFPGYRLLTEYFAFPSKFLFVDLVDLGPRLLGKIGNRLEIFFYLRRSSPDLEHQVGAESFALGCAPVVNLFSQRAEPIQLTQTQYEYRVVPDARRPLSTEVYSVDRVAALSRFGDEQVYLPFFSVRHATRDTPRRTFFTASRRVVGRSGGQADPGTDVSLSLVDLDLAPSVPADSVLAVDITCLNRDLPSRLPFGGDQPRLELEGGAPLSSIRCLTKPTPTLRPPLGKGALWRLISHLSLNHLSIAEGEGAADALREILRLYDLRDSAETRATIDGIVSVGSRPTTGRAPASRQGGICRGVEVRVEFDPERFTGGGIYLFASVLERFLSLYTTVNSFTRTVATVKGREGVLRRWPARAGETVLL